MDKDIENEVDNLTVSCPWCFAPKGEECRNPFNKPHASRVLKAEAYSEPDFRGFLKSTFSED